MLLAAVMVSAVVVDVVGANSVGKLELLEVAAVFV
ncbi:hypothetical protein SDC9_198808 [bioreactor metagenome]|uniref:Uncharacterized protein n=1 Tax=bioreactor metagenome TaxID=1076179 RepID=A0A645IJJ6_9ZZZZ